MDYLRIVYACLSVLHVKAQTPTGYLGCFLDDSLTQLDITLKTSKTNTGHECQWRCSLQGYRYAGTQYGNQCHCGNSINNYQEASGCNIECPGNWQERCGGHKRISIYDTRNESISSTLSTTTIVFTSIKSSETSRPRSTQLPDIISTSSSGMNGRTKSGKERLTTRPTTDPYPTDRASLKIVYILVPVGCVTLLIPVIITSLVIRSCRKRSKTVEHTRQAQCETNPTYYDIYEKDTTTGTSWQPTSAKENYGRTANIHHTYDDIELKHEYQDLNLYLTPMNSSRVEECHLYKDLKFDVQSNSMQQNRF